ncbi:gastrokine-1-like [Calypte anna]|uniref:gastrokine-1-like n=1 Tax=Calypte anna TaxID=9244 RepID=UPI0011C3A5C8|nr:gastrokine-1-like [Calypte anna]XP_030319801.1 gastrokine-1-like [Calypte anna]
MKFTIVATVLLGLWLVPALAQYFQDQEGLPQVINPVQSQTITKQVTVNGGLQILLINRQFRVATIEQQNSFRSWKTIWNYESGFIATKVQAACYVSVMNRAEMPSFNSLPQLADSNRNLLFPGQPAKQITFQVQGPVQNLQAYGQKVVSMCRGLPTYVATETYGLENTYSQSCTRLDVLGVVELQYCRTNINIDANIPVKGSVSSFP